MSTVVIRRDEWADAVFDAVRALRAAMGDPASGIKAAVELLKLEVARIRHGRAVAGTDSRDADDALEPLGAPASRGSAMDQLDDEDRALVRELSAMFAPPLPPDLEPWELEDEGEQPAAAVGPAGRRFHRADRRRTGRGFGRRG